ncbi:hypothetical protein [Nocardioides conyzicola]|uniref:Lipoprotein n=1 Tax=Nocardioides conyzicola TaxID=1651781 RepID=A0ABP8X103_9ACTN
MIGDVSRTRAALTALFLIPVLLLAGCSDDEPKPKFAPPSSEAPTSPTTTEVDPQAAFIDEFFSEVTNSISSGDPTPFLEMAPGCKNCQVIARNLSAAYEDGGRIEGGRWTVESATKSSESEWSLSLRTAEERWLDADDQVVKIVDPATLQVSLLLKPAGSGWTVQEMKLG